jgi:hypothetical protein
MVWARWGQDGTFMRQHMVQIEQGGPADGGIMSMLNIAR